MKHLYTVKIPALKGDKQIKDSKFFDYIDPDFKNWKIKPENKKTKAMLLDVLEIDKNGTFQDFFTKNQALTQEQILWFVKNHKDKLRTDGFATIFLFKSKGDFFVASVHFYSGGLLYVFVSQFEYDFVWDAEYRHRVVVVPHLAETLKPKPFDPLKLEISYNGVKYKLTKI